MYRVWSVYRRRKISAIAAASGGGAERGGVGREREAKETRWKKRREAEEAVDEM